MLAVQWSDNNTANGPSSKTKWRLEHMGGETDGVITIVLWLLFGDVSVNLHDSDHFPTCWKLHSADWTPFENICNETLLS